MTHDPLPLDGRICLVTGAARGIGHAIALALASAGADVALGLRDAASGGDVADEVRALGRTALELQMDVTDLDQVTSAVERSSSGWGGWTCWSTTRASGRPRRRPRTSTRTSSTRRSP